VNVGDHIPDLNISGDIREITHKAKKPLFADFQIAARSFFEQIFFKDTKTVSMYLSACNLDYLSN
jgi:hypothetical protein